MSEKAKNFNFNTDLIGLTPEEARAKTGLQIRVRGKGNESFFGTCDFVPTRINVHVDENNKIVSVGNPG